MPRPTIRQIDRDTESRVDYLSDIFDFRGFSPAGLLNVLQFSANVRADLENGCQLEGRRPTQQQLFKSSLAHELDIVQVRAEDAARRLREQSRRTPRMRFPH